MRLGKICVVCRSGTYKKRTELSDFTPPANITLLITDIGVLTPSVVSDKLSKLHYFLFSVLSRCGSATGRFVSRVSSRAEPSPEYAARTEKSHLQVHAHGCLGVACVTTRHGEMHVINRKPQTPG